MAAGRTSTSSGGGGSGHEGSAQWSSTRTRVSITSARGSPVTATAVSTTTVYEQEQLSSSTTVATGTSSSAEQLHDDADDDADDTPTISRSSNAFKSDSEDAYEDDDDVDDEDDWEDVGNEQVFRDFKFSDLIGDADDSEYAPSENEDDNKADLHERLSDDELSASDLEVEEEESSVAGLFASVARQFSASKRRAKGSESHSAEDSTAFGEQDRAYWATAEEKQQWVQRFDAANKQFVHKYGCRIDSPAHPEAKAKLRREKKKKNVYALILFALCVAYLVQLVAMSTNTVLTVQSVVDGVTKCVRAVPYPADLYAGVLEKLSALSPAAENDRTTGTAAVGARDAVIVDEEAEAVAVADIHESEQELSGDSVERTVEVVEGEGVTENAEDIAVVEEKASEETLAEPEVEAEQPVDEAATPSSYADENNQAAVAEEAANAKTTESQQVGEEKPTDYARVAVQLCSKHFARLVKSKNDQTVKDSAIRACDAAVELAPSDSRNWIEARVLRGDLWSFVSAFDPADDDYNAAAAAVETASLSPELQEQESSLTPLSQDIQAKILANKWISLFTKHSYKELRQEVARVAKSDRYAAPMRALASDWLLVFKKKKQPFEVLTATRMWTLQRLEYA